MAAGCVARAPCPRQPALGARGCCAPPATAQRAPMAVKELGPRGARPALWDQPVGGSGRVPPHAAPARAPDPGLLGAVGDHAERTLRRAGPITVARLAGLRVSVTTRRELVARPSRPPSLAWTYRRSSCGETATPSSRSTRAGARRAPRRRRLARRGAPQPIWPVPGQRGGASIAICAVPERLRGRSTQAPGG
jgi:hypothetical protein